MKQKTRIVFGDDRWRLTQKTPPSGTVSPNWSGRSAWWGRHRQRQSGIDSILNTDEQTEQEGRGQKEKKKKKNLCRYIMKLNTLHMSS